jgi:glycosyltransferase involved in cell wall biosynthesis
MKILHIIPNLKKGGAERLVIEIVRGFIQNNSIEIKLILFENKMEYNVSGIASHIEIVPASVNLSILKKNRLEISTLQNAIEKFQPDVIHSHLFEAEIVSRSCYYPKAKWFSHGHDRMRSFSKLRLTDLTNKRTWTNFFEKNYLFNRYKKNGGNHFIAISEDILDFLKGILTSDLKHISLLHNAINIQQFSAKEKVETPKENNTCYLISIGRLDANKNHAFLLEAVAQLKSMGLSVLLRIVGEGDQRVTLEKTIERSKLENEVLLLGMQDNVEIFLWESDIYVHSAITEGFGLTLLEAMASGLPVVSLDGGGNKELLIEGKNGFLIKEHDPVQFAQRIAYLWGEKQLMAEMKLFARNFVEPFSMQHYCENLMNLYKIKTKCAE